MNIDISIPVTIAGYTGQRDAWEEHEAEYRVGTISDQEIQLTSSGPTQQRISFNLEDLQHAVEMRRLLNERRLNAKRTN